LAENLIDFMLSQIFQEDMPLNMFVYPANENADLPAEFVEWTQVPVETAVLPPETIDANREQWIEAWTEVVLR
jgi:thiamine transport system substrate-binding protein